MKQRPAIMNKGNMIGATERAKDRVRRTIELAKEIEGDTRKAERLKKYECKACFYYPRIGGSAVTQRPCMCCGSDEMYCSTATDVLCKPCAEKHSLCKRCGGDLEMRPRRKDWPAPPCTSACTSEKTDAVTY